MPFIDITPHNNNVNFDKFKHYHDISQETKDVSNTSQKNLNLILSHLKIVLM